jgi:1-acyl-sn-glycerol-3-phosphate acyltransferase
MITFERLENIRLSAQPVSHRILGQSFLKACYDAGGRVDITVHNRERFPDKPVVIAMNHTDRYNYWPLQYWMYKHMRRYTATWVKGKYYERALVARFMEATNNIPTVSKGYVVSKDFMLTTGRKPTDAEYRSLKGLLDSQLYDHQSAARSALAPPAIFDTPRSILGQPYDPATESWPEAAAASYNGLMARFVELNRRANGLGCDIIVFPEGTRSIRVANGHIGLAQMALALDAEILPVGCSGSHLCYPAGSPWPRPGKIDYRVGHPISVAKLRELAPVRAFTPFDPSDERELREPFQNLVDYVMDRINELVDQRHVRLDDEDHNVSGAHTAADRFL